MDKYEVKLYPRAFRDIEGIYAYIALEKLAPENAKGQTERIWEAIKSKLLRPFWVMRRPLFIIHLIKYDLVITQKNFLLFSSMPVKNKQPRAKAELSMLII